MSNFGKNPDLFPKEFHAWMRERFEGEIGRFLDYQAAFAKRQLWYAFRYSIRQFPAHVLFGTEARWDGKTRLRREGEGWRLTLYFVDKGGELEDIHEALQQ